LERDIKAVKKAREALGDAAPKFGSVPRRDRDDIRGFTWGGRGGGVLGKRRRDDESSDSDIPDDVKNIPMPRDTPPPIPKEVLDKWYQARRDRMGINRDAGGRGTSANSMPLGQNDRRAALNHGQEASPNVPEKPKVEAKVVYESKPVVRDLRKEAIAFVPAAVRVKLDKGRGLGGLVEPEEADRLEREGYMGTAPDAKKVMIEEVKDEDG